MTAARSSGAHGRAVSLAMLFALSGAGVDRPSSAAGWPADTSPALEERATCTASSIYDLPRCVAAGARPQFETGSKTPEVFEGRIGGYAADTPNGSTHVVVPADGRMSTVVEVGPSDRDLERAFERVAQAGDRIVAIAVVAGEDLLGRLKRERTALLVERSSEATAEVRYRLILARARRLEGALNDAARDGFSVVSEVAPAATYGLKRSLFGTPVCVLMQMSGPLARQTEYRVTDRFVHGGGVLERTFAGAVSGFADVNAAITAGFTPLLAVDGRMVLSRPSGEPLLPPVDPGLYRTAVGRVDEISVGTEVNRMAGDGYEVVGFDVNEDANALLILRRSGQPRRYQLRASRELLDLQVQMNRAAGEGYVLWRRGVISRGPFVTALMVDESVATASEEYAFAGPFESTTAAQLSRDFTTIGLVDFDRPFLLLRDRRQGVSTLPPSSASSADSARAFQALPALTRLGAPVAVDGPAGTLRGALARLSSQSLAVAHDHTVNVLMASQITAVRDRGKPGRFGGRGALVGVGVGLVGAGVWAAQCEEGLLQNDCRAGAFLVGGLALGAAGAAIGGTVGWLVARFVRDERPLYVAGGSGEATGTGQVPPVH